MQTRRVRRHLRAGTGLGQQVEIRIMSKKQMELWLEAVGVNLDHADKMYAVTGYDGWRDRAVFFLFWYRSLLKALGYGMDGRKS